MRTFAKIIFIFFIFHLSAPFHLAAEMQLAPGLLLRDDSSGSNFTFLRNVIRQLDRYARTADVKRRRERTVTVYCGKGDYFGYYRGDRLYFPGDAFRWMEDLSLRRKIYAALAAWRFGFELPRDTNGLAEWIVCGIDAEIAAAAGSGMFISANRDYPLLMEISGYCGTLPDYAAMCRAGHTDEPILHDFLAEQSRLLLTITAENGKIGDLFRRTANNEAADCFLDYYASPADAAEKLAAETISRLWNRYRPMPPKLAQIRLAELDIIFVQLCDDAGNPSGDYIECSWRKLAELLTAPRKDAGQLRNSLAEKYLAFGKLLNDHERNLCRNIANAAKDLGKDDDADDAFADNLKKLQSALDRRIATDRFLRDTLLRSTPLPDNFARLFFAAKVQNSAANESEIQFLNRILNDYLR